MKKMFFLFLILLVCSGLSYSQVTMTAGNITATPGDSVTIPVNVANFSRVGAITIKVQYTTTALTWGRVLNADAQLTGALAGASSGVVTFAWDAIAGMNLASGKLFDLKFLYTGGNATLTFTAQCEIADVDGNPINVTYTGGSVKPAAVSMSGSYYIGAPGTGPQGANPAFASLKAAVDSINNATFSGDCTFYITSNLTESKNFGIGVNPAPYKITIKPMVGTVDTVTFTQTADNAGASGAFLIGIKDLVNSAQPPITTKNIIIDGSNAVNGASRDLIFRTTSTSHANTYPFRLFGDISEITLKNIVVATGQSVSYGILITNRFASNTTYTPKNVTIDNCDVTNKISISGQGVAISNSGSYPTTFPTGIVISNNNINATTRGIFLNYAGSTDIFGNNITIEQKNTGYLSTYIYAYTVGSATSSDFTTNIFNNKLLSISSANATAANGIYGVWIGSRGKYNVYNNFISGFNPTATSANPSFVLQGIRLESADAIANVINNTIVINDFPFNRGTGSLSCVGIQVVAGTDTVVNNIVYSAKTVDSSYCIYRQGTAGSLFSDYNLLYAGSDLGMVGYINNAAVKSLADWKTAAGGDANSISYNPLLKSVTDLHLSGPATPPMGKGIYIARIPKDIDGDVRDNPCEIGADEIPGVTPVELASFTAAASGSSVIIKWSTATETNNSNFTIEKRTAASTWATIATVKGNGTTTLKHDYSYVDNNIANAKVYYRLRQNDFDGSYTYSKEIEVSANTVPAGYELSQNFPNPFNPSTVIKYSVPVASRVRIDVYSVTGQLVSTLVNGYMEAGSHEVTMKADNLSSGVYIYKLSAGSVVLSKKMQLIK
jgi:hypothetical protein